MYFEFTNGFITYTINSRYIMTLSQLPYLFNIIVLLPIALPTLLGLFPVDQASFNESQGWRMLVGAMWTSILTLSIFGFFHTKQFSPLLVMQVIYKFLWLISYVVPKLKNKHYEEIPIGITSSFVFIIIVYPLFIPWSYLFI